MRLQEKYVHASNFNEANQHLHQILSKSIKTCTSLQQEEGKLLYN